MPVDEQETLWWTWKQTEKPEDLSSLLHTFEPLIQHKVRRIGNQTIPPSAIEGEAKRQAIRAFKSFDPQKGVQLSTHVGNQLKKVDRYVMQRQAVGRLPEEQILRTGTFRQAQGELVDRLGREPTTQELADHLRWSPGQVARTRRGLRGEVALSENPLFEELNPTYREHFDAALTLQFVYQDLEPEQQQVFEYTFGHGGQPELKTNQEIATQMGISEAKVRKVKGQIFQQLAPFLGGR